MIWHVGDSRAVECNYEEDEKILVGGYGSIWPKPGVLIHCNPYFLRNTYAYAKTFA